MKRNHSDEQIDAVKRIHRQIRVDILGRLEEFRRLRERGSEEEIFTELVFCLLTPQSKARMCGRAVDLLRGKDLIFRGCSDDISDVLNIVRFRNNKARYIVLARDQLTRNGGIAVRSLLESHRGPLRKREWLAENIKGMGYKEASHFLRNTGWGERLAILDRHILKNLKLMKVIEAVPGSIGRNSYLSMESDMRAFSRRIGIPLAHLDFVLWYREAEDIFK